MKVTSFKFKVDRAELLDYSNVTPSQFQPVLHEY